MRIVEAIEIPEMHHHDHVVAFALHPAVEGQHAVLIVDVDHAEPLSAQARILPAKPDQLAREPQMIEHLLVAVSSPAQWSNRFW